MVEETYQKNTKDCQDVICTKVGSVAFDPVNCIAHISWPREGRGVEELLPWPARRYQSMTLLFEFGDQIGDTNSRRGLELRCRSSGGDSGYRRRWIGGGDLDVGSGGRIGDVREGIYPGSDSWRGGAWWCISDVHRRSWRRSSTDRAIGGGGGGGGVRGAVAHRERENESINRRSVWNEWMDEVVERGKRGLVQFVINWRKLTRCKLPFKSFSLEKSS